MLGEHGLGDWANDVNQSGAQDPTKGDGELERALTRRSVRPFFLWDPNAEVLIRAENLDA